MPDQMYIYHEVPFAFFVYEEYGLQVVFLYEGIHTTNLMWVAMGSWGQVSNTPLPANWSVNMAVNLFRYCRGIADVEIIFPRDADCENAAPTELITAARRRDAVLRVRHEPNAQIATPQADGKNAVPTPQITVSLVEE